MRVKRSGSSNVACRTSCVMPRPLKVVVMGIVEDGVVAAAILRWFGAVKKDRDGLIDAAGLLL